MERASTLLQHVSDAATGARSSNLSESDLINRLEDVKKQLQRSESAAIPPKSIAIGVCHVTTQVVGFLVQFVPVPAQTASSKWQKRVFLLETAVASALTSIGGSKDADLAPKSQDKRELCHFYRRLLHRLWETSQSPQQAINAVTIMTQLCVLLAICWLSYDRVGRLVKVEELLSLCSGFCLEHESTKNLAKWPLFLLGMVNMVEKQDYDAALRCFQGAVERCDGSEVQDGVFFYWNAVALIHNGLVGGVVTALDKCIGVNYEPVACLSLQASVNLQAQDFYAAAEQLQRALGIDCTQSRSLFNYALLMERMGNFEAQQQLLEYVLESDGDVGSGQSASNKRKRPSDVIDLSSSTKAPTLLFDEASLKVLLPSRLTSVNTSMVHFHLALAAMENGKRTMLY